MVGLIILGLAVCASIIWLETGGIDYIKELYERIKR